VSRGLSFEMKGSKRKPAQGQQPTTLDDVAEPKTDHLTGADAYYDVLLPKASESYNRTGSRPEILIRYPALSDAG
jgi:hypothetical protein